MSNTEPSLTRAIERAESNLQRLLDWIGRYDSRISFVTGVGVAMLGYVAAITPPLAKWTTCLSLSFIAFSVLLVACMVFIYRGQYPNTKSQNTSLLYFGTIADVKLDEFTKRFRNMSDSEYLDDLLSQAHTNASIIAAKFRSLKIALVFLVLSTIAWGITIYFSKLIQ